MEAAIFINGEDVNTLEPPELLRLRRSTGFVFQNSAVFDSITVSENIALPLRYNSDKARGEIQDKVRQHLLQVGLERDGDKMPDKLSVGMRSCLHSLGRLPLILTFFSSTIRGMVLTPTQLRPFVSCCSI